MISAPAETPGKNLDNILAVLNNVVATGTADLQETAEEVVDTSNALIQNIEKNPTLQDAAANLANTVNQAQSTLSEAAKKTLNELSSASLSTELGSNGANLELLA